MAKFNYDSSNTKLERFIKEGRGQGRGSDYKPFLKVNSISSRGRVTRVKGWKTGRVHHFLTDNETRYFYLCEWSDACVDIREHFPLYDLFEMTDILDDTLRKRLYDKNGVPNIYTSSFLITTKDEQGNEIHFARNVKEKRELEKTNVIERYEIIRRYWKEKGINWGLVTPDEINNVRAKNIEWIHNAYVLNEWEYSENDLKIKIMLLMESLRESNGTIRQVIEQFDCENEKGEGLLLFKHLVANKEILIDMDKPINLNSFVNKLSFS